jgi:NAD(P)-dependent dehydrogenase (short-subunit alcohol dehydrogenase family)
MPGTRLKDRVAIVTGSGRGLGRAHALALADQGARVVVNDLGGDTQGQGHDLTPAQQVAEEIRGLGGEALVSGHDVSDWAQAEALIGEAVRHFGELHILVNNAGILRDRLLANMSEAEWDAVIRVHLKGHAATSRHAMAHWRARSKDGHAVKASVIHTGRQTTRQPSSVSSVSRAWLRSRAPNTAYAPMRYRPRREPA